MEVRDLDRLRGFAAVNDKPILVRAFELAPECSSLKDLTRLLREEGYDSVERHLYGLGLRRQLQARYNGANGIKANNGQKSPRAQTAKAPHEPS
jgi:hypothetical protein